MDRLDIQEEDRLLMQYIDEKKDCIVDLTEKIDRPPVCLSKGEKIYKGKNGLTKFEIPLATYGNFSFVQAPPKSYKTFFMSLLASAYAGADAEYVSDIVSHRGNRQLVHFDTEQGKWHCKRVFMRVIDMLGTNTIPDFYHTFSLRELNYQSRRLYIEYKLQQMVDDGKKIGFVVIDGIADLVSDVNDLKHSNLVVQWLMEITTKFHCHIITIIHSNYGSEKPTGHLGSLLEKKAETQYNLKPNQETGCIDVVCRRTRNVPFKPFSFNLTDTNLPIIS